MQPRAERLIRGAAGGVGELVGEHAPGAGGPWVGSGREERDSVLWREARGEVPAKERLRFGVVAVAQLEAVGNHEVGERALTGSVADVQDGDPHTDRLAGGDLGDVVGWPVIDAGWVAVQRECPVDLDFWSASTLQCPWQEQDDRGDRGGERDGVEEPVPRVPLHADGQLPQ